MRSDELPAATHSRFVAAFDAEARALESRINRISLGLLGLFLIAAGMFFAAFAGNALLYGTASGAAFSAFIALRIFHARTDAARQLAEQRAQIHRRHLARLGAEWMHFDIAPGIAGHPYANDIDLVGSGASLIQRYDVSHTLRGQALLTRWLGAAESSLDTILVRQNAVRELSKKLEFRRELELKMSLARADTRTRTKLDDTAFLEFVGAPDAFEGNAALRIAARALPVATVLAMALAAFISQFRLLALFLVAVNLLLNLATAQKVNRIFNIVSARSHFLDAFVHALSVLRGANFENARLRELQAQISDAKNGADVALQRLERWAGFAEFRKQGPIYIVLNQILLWDLNCVLHLETWKKEHASHARSWFDAVAELESLSSLATILHHDPDATFPTLASVGAFEATSIAHPLLDPKVRVANDVSALSPAEVLIVTGSNMAGKSTLLRAVGLNIALGLAGGPVIAKSMHIPRVRLRASMRAEDSLELATSYFRAELEKLRIVIAAAEEAPPIFFLLDELLRGTNEKARHEGARAVVWHLLERNALGLVATHDVALAALENDFPSQVHNAHFTDVMKDGEMFFDYALQPGIVQTSNALELLRRAGISLRK